MKRTVTILVNVVILVAFASIIVTQANTQMMATAVQKMTILDSFAYPNTLHQGAIGVEIEYWGETFFSKFYFSFEPKPTFQSVSHIYINGIWASDDGRDYTVRYEFSNTATITGTVQSPGYYPKSFDHDAAVSTINVGINELTIKQTTSSINRLWLLRLDLFIEYQYQEEIPPSVAEVSYPELLMILGFGLVIAYNVYNKLKPRLSKAAKTDPNTLLGK